MYVFVNPISICNKFKNLGRNSDSYCQVKEYARSIQDREIGRVCHLVVLKGILVTVTVVFLFKNRFS